MGIETGNPWAGVAAGIIAGAALSAVFAAMVLVRGANQIAMGLVPKGTPLARKPQAITTSPTPWWPSQSTM